MFNILSHAYYYMCSHFYEQTIRVRVRVRVYAALTSGNYNAPNMCSTRACVWRLRAVRTCNRTVIARRATGGDSARVCVRPAHARRRYDL